MFGLIIAAIIPSFFSQDNPTTSGGEDFNESYWKKRSEIALDTAKELLEITQDIYEDTSLGFNKYSITLTVGGYNQMVVRKRSGKSVLISMRYGSKHDEIETILEEMEVPYTDKHKHFYMQMPGKKVSEFRDNFRKIATLNKQWWNG